LIFHNGGNAIRDYRKCWHTVCLTNGLGAYYCRECRNEEGKLNSVLDAHRKCPNCGERYTAKHPGKYIGKLVHDFRRTASHELWKSGNSIEECMAVTGHKTDAMFKRYADLFSDEERKAMQQATQLKRREWREAQAQNVVTMPKRAM